MVQTEVERQPITTNFEELYRVSLHYANSSKLSRARVLALQKAWMYARASRAGDQKQLPEVMGDVQPELDHFTSDEQFTSACLNTFDIYMRRILRFSELSYEKMRDLAAQKVRSEIQFVWGKTLTDDELTEIKMLWSMLQCKE